MAQLQSNTRNSLHFSSNSLYQEQDETPRSIPNVGNDDGVHSSMVVRAQSFMVHSTSVFNSGMSAFGQRSAISATSLSNTSSDAIGSNGSFSKQLLEKMINFLVSLNSKKPKQDSWKSVLMCLLLNGYLLYCTVILSSVLSTLYEEGTVSSSFGVNDDSYNATNTTTTTNSSLSKGHAPMWGVVAGWIQRALFYPLNFGAEHYPYQVVIALSASGVFLELCTLFMYYVFYMLLSRGHRFSEKIKKIALPFTQLMLPLSNWMIWLHCIPMSTSFTSSNNEYFPSIANHSRLNIVFIVVGSVGVLLNIVIGCIGTMVTCETIPPIETKFACFTMDRPDAWMVITLLNQISVVLTVVLNTNNVIASSVVKFILSACVVIYFVRRCPYFKIWENGIVLGCLLAKTFGSIGPLITSAIQPYITTQLESMGGLMFGVTCSLQLLGLVVGGVALSIYLRILVKSVKNFMSKTMKELPDKSSAFQIYSTFEARKSLNQLVLFLRLSIASAFSESPSALDVSIQFLKNCGNKSFSNVDFLLISALIEAFYSSHEDVYTSNTHVMNMLINAKKNNPSHFQRYLIMLRFKELEINMEKVSGMNIEVRQALQSIQKKQDVLFYFHKEFFKELLSEKPSQTKLLNLNRSATKLMSDCESSYRTLYAKHPNDKILLRFYASFLETFQWENEAANELKEEANSADDDDHLKKQPIAAQESLRTNAIQSKKFNNKVHPNVVIPSSSYKNKLSSVDKIIDEEITERRSMDEEEDRWESVSHAGEIDKKENVLRLAINSKEENSAAKTCFSLFVLLSLVVVPTLFAASSITLSQISVRVALEEKVCSLSGIPHLIIAQIRSVQSKFRCSFTPEKKADLPFVVAKAKVQIESLLEKVNRVKEASLSNEFIPEVVSTFTEVKWPYLIPIKQKDENASPLFETANSSISQYIDLILDQGPQILTMMNDLEAFNLTRSNFPFLILKVVVRS